MAIKKNASIEINEQIRDREVRVIGAEGEQLGIMSSKDASKMAVKTISEATPLVNTDVLSKLKMTMPEKYSSAQTVTTNK